jgi:hypothetical protein
LNMASVMNNFTLFQLSLQALALPPLFWG